MLNLKVQNVAHLVIGAKTKCLSCIVVSQDNGGYLYFTVCFTVAVSHHFTLPGIQEHLGVGYVNRQIFIGI